MDLALPSRFPGTLRCLIPKMIAWEPWLGNELSLETTVDVVENRDNIIVHVALFLRKTKENLTLKAPYPMIIIIPALLVYV